jgi:phage baseplate assembly protein W
LASNYRDLDLDFGVHPTTKKLTTLTGDQAVKRAVRNLLLTHHYEKPFHPDIGSHVTSLLFENLDSFTAERLQDEIFRVLENYEPRVRVTNVRVDADADNNGFVARIAFFIEGQITERTADFFLERVR